MTPQLSCWLCLWGSFPSQSCRTQPRASKLHRSEFSVTSPSKSSIDLWYNSSKIYTENGALKAILGNFLQQNNMIAVEWRASLKWWPFRRQFMLEKQHAHKVLVLEIEWRGCAGNITPRLVRNSQTRNEVWRSSALLWWRTHLHRVNRSWHTHHTASMRRIRTPE